MNLEQENPHWKLKNDTRCEIWVAAVIRLQLTADNPAPCSDRLLCGRSTIVSFFFCRSPSWFYSRVVIFQMNIPKNNSELTYKYYKISTKMYIYIYNY